MWRMLFLLLIMIGVSSRVAATTLKHDPTQRPVNMTTTQQTLQKKYPIDMVIVGSRNKVLKIGYKSYTIGDQLDSMKIVDIQMNKVLLEDGRHGYITLLIKR
ncbi:MAG: hypothetical protein GY821_02165 [Gammaproteobacteria bacterium]|nr:hypothetical protein [Gammaproteobacteria bacterium]